MVQLDTRFAPGDAVSVAVTYLASYEHMGHVRIWCQAACTCDAVKVDALLQEQGLKVGWCDALEVCGYCCVCFTCQECASCLLLTLRLH